MLEDFLQSNTSQLITISIKKINIYELIRRGLEYADSWPSG